MIHRIGRYALAASIVALAAALAACSDGQSSPPAVSAGPDQSVTGQTSVRLAASSTTAVRAYHWRFKSRPPASRLMNADIRNADTAVAYFTPDAAGAYVLKLTAETAHGKASDTVRVASRLAVAAGPDRVVYGSQPVTLQARSNAPRPGYDWSLVSRPAGSEATLAGAHTASPSFTPDVSGVYKARVGLAGEAPSDTVKITAKHVWQPGVIPRATTPAADTTALALAPDGTLYIAYHDRNEGGKTVVKRLTDGKWVKLGGEPASAAYSRFMRLEVTPQGTPIVAFQDFGAQGRGGITVRRFTDGEWATLGRPGFSAGQAAFIALAIAPDGTPWVAYQDFSDQATGGLSVQKFSQDKWQTLGRAGFSGGEAHFIALAIDARGTPYVAFRDFADRHNGASVFTFDGKVWQPVGDGAGLSPGAATFISLALAPDGTPYIAYEDGGAENPATVRKLSDDGSHWGYVGQAWFTRSESEFTTIAFAPDGTPYIAYQDWLHGGLSVQKFDGDEWQFVGEPGISPGEAEGISMVIAGDGSVFVAYRGETGRAEAAEAKKGETEEEEGVSVIRFDGEHWVPAGGTVDAWREEAERRREGH